MRCIRPPPLWPSRPSLSNGSSDPIMGDSGRGKSLHTKGGRPKAPLVRRKYLRNICVIGTGYVGLVTGTCLADMGNQVTCVDIIPEKIERLRQGILPISEPGLEEMVERNVHARRLRFTTSYSEGLDETEFTFLAVQTPTGSLQGGADMRYIESAAQIGRASCRER